MSEYKRERHILSKILSEKKKKNNVIIIKKPVESLMVINDETDIICPTQNILTFCGIIAILWIYSFLYYLFFG